MIGTGVRWGELVRLDSTCVGRDGALAVAAPKTGKLRHVPIPPALLRELRTHVGVLVPFGKGRSESTSFNQMVRRRSGFKEFGANRCRHTYAYRWLEQGGNLGALQVAMGHSVITTTMRYAKPTEELLRREAERMWKAEAVVPASPVAVGHHEGHQCRRRSTARFL